MSLDLNECYEFIITCCVIGVLFACYNLYLVSRVILKGHDIPLQNEQHDDESHENLEQNDVKLVVEKQDMANQVQIDLLKKIGDLVANGAHRFLMSEYYYLAFFVAAFTLIIFFAVDLNDGEFKFYTCFAFLLGASTSVFSGFVGMKVGTYANTRTAYEAQISLGRGFQLAFRAGNVMGFFLTSMGLFVLVILIAFYRSITNNIQNPQNLRQMYEYITGYGLGGSTVALFARVGGGIYTKAADVGADLVGKVENSLDEDSPYNPATIADNVGDNVGDIAGMGADLFGSFAESTCAALAISGTSLDFQSYQEGSAILYPLVITSFGILGCIVTSLFATNYMSGILISYYFLVLVNEHVERTLKYQILISSLILTPLLWIAAYITLPPDGFKIPSALSVQVRYPYHAAICTISGLWGGMIIGYVTEYMTSHTYNPVREVANSCQTGAATNIIYGLALGYYSNIIPVFTLAVCLYISFKLLGLYGIALAAIGMLSNLPTSLAIDSYGPISDNAGGMAEMSQLGEHVRQRTDALDAAGNTTAAIGKGFAIGSACLVSLSLYGAFVVRAGESDGIKINVSDIKILDPLVFSMLLIGSMLPYWFAAMCMKSVGKAALEMVQEVRNQIKEKPGILNGTQEPNYDRCISISTKASLAQMIAPGALVILSPIICGFFFGPKAVAGLIPGALVSGVQLGISQSNTGGAWDNAKKYIESGQLYIDGVQKKKGTEEHKAAVIGDTVGDPLKDTSGPSINILIKLMAIISLVFSQFFTKTGILVKLLGDE